jgi:hypothetical protein
VDSILLSSLILHPRRSSRMWIEPFACLVFIALLFPFLRFPSFAIASGSKEGESRVSFCPLVLSCLTLVCLYLLDRSVSLVIVVTTAPLRTLGMS